MSDVSIKIATPTASAKDDETAATGSSTAAPKTEKTEFDKALDTKQKKLAEDFEAQRLNLNAQNQTQQNSLSVNLTGNNTNASQPLSGIFSNGGISSTNIVTKSVIGSIESVTAANPANQEKQESSSSLKAKSEGFSQDVNAASLNMI
ncbi:MAG: hypothetical protein WC860_01910 [Candidatus Margulisiibacteriota bacterium]|jgi:hypothetical protein